MNVYEQVVFDINKSLEYETEEGIRESLKSVISKYLLFNNTEYKNDPDVIISVILNTVSSFYSIPIKTLQKKIRKKEIVKARQIAFYLIKKYTKLTLTGIGLRVGEFDHATVLHSIKVVNNDIETYPAELKILNDLIILLNKNLSTLTSFKKIYIKDDNKQYIFNSEIDNFTINEFNNKNTSIYEWYK